MPQGFQTDGTPHDISILVGPSLMGPPLMGLPLMGPPLTAFPFMTALDEGCSPASTSIVPPASKISTVSRDGGGPLDDTGAFLGVIDIGRIDYHRDDHHRDDHHQDDHPLDDQEDLSIPVGPAAPTGPRDETTIEGTGIFDPGRLLVDDHADSFLFRTDDAHNDPSRSAHARDQTDDVESAEAIPLCGTTPAFLEETRTEWAGPEDDDTGEAKDPSNDSQGPDRDPDQDPVEMIQIYDFDSFWG